MRAFVTGVDGFVGQWLARELIEAGIEVAGGSRAPLPSYSILSEAEAREIRWSMFELTEPESLANALAQVQPDIVFHLAAQASVPRSIAEPAETFETNVIGTVHLLEAVLSHAAHATVLCIGSADAYGPVAAGELPLRETARLHPTNPYAASKAAAETVAMQYARSQELHVIATRSFNHTGPGQRTDFAVPAFAKQIADIAKGREQPVLRVGNLDARRDYTDVRDVVRAYRLIAERGEAATVYNVCSGKSVAMREVVDDLIALAGVNVRIEVDQGRLRPVDTPDIVGDNTLLREHTGWAPKIPWSQTLRDVYEWQMRAKGIDS